MKHILGIDLGSTSIGWAFVKEAENDDEQSSIEKIGVRVNPLTTDEQTNFEKGKPVSVNADRTLKRGMRRNLDRYQLRRDNLIEVLRKANIISEDTTLAENGKNTTHQTWHLRSKAVTEKIEKEDLARVLLAINKKRGYKNSRKARDEDEGQAVDGMAIAKRLYDENLTPGQLVFQLLSNGKKHIPDFYRSDLQSEFDKVWKFQKQFYPKILTDTFYKELQGKGQRTTSALFWHTYKFNTADIKDLEEGLKNENTIKLNKRAQKKLQAYKWRNDAVSEQLEKEKVAYVLTEINNNLNQSSGYLGAISDRSKELYFNKETVGQNLYKQLQNNPHTRLKNQVFYRQDYLDEFEAIWKEQSKYHPELTGELKEKIRDIVIFYQRKLKSQKGLISFCEFESKEKIINGKKKTIGRRVAPKSSPLFQEFKIWQVLGYLKFVNKETGEIQEFKNDDTLELKQLLFDELNLKGNLSASKVLDILEYNKKEWELTNFKVVEGNRTNLALYDAYFKIIEREGFGEIDWEKYKTLKEKSEKTIFDCFEFNSKVSKVLNYNVNPLSKIGAGELIEIFEKLFSELNINTEILKFNAELKEKAFEQQASYQLWHLLYSYEGDDSVSGNELLYKLLQEKFGFTLEHAKILANVSFQEDYGNLSTKAMCKIFPYIKEHQYSEACEQAGYRHSKHSLSKEELKNRELKPRLELLKKNSLRNPVVEKILNQMVNVVNTLLDTERKKDPGFRFDEIRIELARELKKNARQRAEMTSNINKAKARHEAIYKTLQDEFGVKNPTRNDIIRYKLYEELKNNGYKDIYTNTYISREKLFTKEIDIEHIIPQSKAFDDSFSNKTISFREDNLEKGNRTAFDYIEEKFGEEGLKEYLDRITALNKKWSKDKPEEGISKAKLLKLQKRESEIGEDFANRDLQDSQYIAKQAKQMLFEISRSVVSTSGSITDRLREDWDLVNVMKELNLPKYKALGLTETQERKYGQTVEVITDWSKRNDHRHHAMDALTVAFTKHNHIQYLNYLNARKNENHKQHGNIIAIETKETEVLIDKNGRKRRKFKEPVPNFRQVAKEHLESVLISHKAKNKVVTKNKNKTRSKNGEKVKIELTPRGQLHKETVYGKIKLPVAKSTKLNKRFTLEQAKMIIDKKCREVVLAHLSKFENNGEVAFDTKNLKKAQLLFNGEPLKEVLCFEEIFTIRKDIAPDLKIDKVIDTRVKEILRERLKKYNGNAKEAFSTDNLDKNPIWLNQKKGISIKRVTITGVSNAEPLHYAKDHFGNKILDANNKPVPVDYISTGNNHHVAIYRDKDGKLQEKVVSFFEAVERVNQNLPIIDKFYNSHLGWEFQFTMKQNEMFVFPNNEKGFNPSEMDLLDPKNKKEISPNLFRVQKIATKNYMFRHHLETNVEDSKTLRKVAWELIQTPANLEGILKVRLNHLGDVVGVGEY